MSLAAILASLATFAPQTPVPAPTADAPCRLSGAFVDEAGAPVRGVTLSVVGRQANSERARQFGLPQGWQDPAPVDTGDDGTFSCSFVPPRAFQFILVASGEGLGRVAWRWGELEPGRELDLGTVTLQREAVLVGHLLDGQGNLLIEDWVVTAWHGSPMGFDGRTETSAPALIDPASGQFRIEGLPPGELRVGARKGTTRLDEVRVTTRSGVETFVELLHRGGDPRRRLIVSIRTQPLFAAPSGPWAVRAIGHDGTRYELSPVTRGSFEWHVPDLEPGAYRVEIRDPRYVDWTRENLRTGLLHTAQLDGNAALRVAVVDGATGAPVKAYDLDVVYRSAAEGRSSVSIHDRTLPAPTDGRHAGILPGDLTVVVEAAGWPTAQVDVDALAPGETRDVTVTLVPAVTLHGRVVDPAGRPVSGVAVQATRSDSPGHGRTGEGASTITADDGVFTFEGLGPGPYTLVASRGRWNDVAATVELPRAEPVVRTLPDAALTTVRLRLPEGESPEGLILQLGHTKGQQFDVQRRARASATHGKWMCDAAGVFGAHHLPLGATVLDLIHVIDEGFGRSHEHVLRHEVVLTEKGAQELEFDLRESFPVRLTLHRPRPALVPEGFWMVGMELTPEGAQRATASNTQSRTQGEREVETRWIAPGVYRVDVRAPGVRWTRPEPVHVVRGAPNVFGVEVPLVGREVRVLDVDGAPLANTLVAYWTDPEQRAVGTTNADGALVLVLLEGTLSLALPPQPDPAPAPPQRGNVTGPRPTVALAVLARLDARATAAFGRGEGPLELRLRPQ